VNTLTAFAIHLELGADWQRFQKAHRVGSWLGMTPSRQQSGESDRQGSIAKTRLDARPAAPGRIRLAARHIRRGSIL